MKGDQGHPCEQAQIEFREAQWEKETTYAGKNKLAHTHSIHRAVP